MKKLSKLEKTILLAIAAVIASGIGFATFADINNAGKETENRTEQMRESLRKLDEVK